MFLLFLLLCKGIRDQLNTVQGFALNYFAKIITHYQENENSFILEDSIPHSDTTTHLLTIYYSFSFLFFLNCFLFFFCRNFSVLSFSFCFLFFSCFFYCCFLSFSLFFPFLFFLFVCFSVFFFVCF